MGDDTVTIRDHAILLLLIHYGLRRGEVERLTLDDVDWVAETLQVMRPKLRRPHGYPLSAPVGEASCDTCGRLGLAASTGTCSSPSMRRSGHCRAPASVPW